MSNLFIVVNPADDSRLTTSFVYLPRIRAPRPSPLLESAYQNYHPILGPSLDREGWDSLPPRVVYGMLFGARRASLECTVRIHNVTRLHPNVIIARAIAAHTAAGRR